MTWVVLPLLLRELDSNDYQAQGERENDKADDGQIAPAFDLDLLSDGLLDDAVKQRVLVILVVDDIAAADVSLVRLPDFPLHE